MASQPREKVGMMTAVQKAGQVMGDNNKAGRGKPRGASMQTYKVFHVINPPQALCTSMVALSE